MTKDELKKAWEAGIELNFAWVDFAKFFDRVALRALRTHPNNDADIFPKSRANQAARDRYEQLNKGWLPRTWEGRQRKLTTTTKHERIYRLQEVYAGELWAIGFRSLPDGSDEIVRIPRQLFNIDDESDSAKNSVTIDWEKGEVSKPNGESYFDVRLLRQPTPEQIDQLTQPVSPNKSRVQGEPPGRPNTNLKIRQKVEELWTTKQFQSLGTRIAQAREIRAQLRGEQHRRTDDMPGYKSIVIQRIIGAVASAKKGKAE